MKHILLVLLFSFSSVFIYGKEWKNIEVYQKETRKENLTASDWLKVDRKKNTIIWQNANRYNLNSNLPKAYLSLTQRRDFYKWIYKELLQKGHEVMWPMMAHFIIDKLRLMQTFPTGILIKKQIKFYSINGSEIVFNNVFPYLKTIYNSNEILTLDNALDWDKKILQKEQYVWLEPIYNNIDKSSLNQIERIAKGKFLYFLVIPKATRFKGSVSNSKMRYNYAINQLKPHCEEIYN